MKKIAFLGLILAVALSACNSVRFDRYPGKALESIPDAFKGKFIGVDTGNKSDTTVYYIGSNAITQLNKDKTKIDFLGAETVFSSAKDAYFICQKDSAYWVIAMVTPSDKGLQIKPVVVENPKKAKKVLKKYFKESTELSGQRFAAKMDEDRLMRYISKNGKASIELQKVAY